MGARKGNQFVNSSGFPAHRPDQSQDLKAQIWMRLADCRGRATVTTVAANKVSIHIDAQPSLDMHCFDMYGGCRSM